MWVPSTEIVRWRYGLGSEGPVLDRGRLARIVYNAAQNDECLEGIVAVFVGEGLDVGVDSV